MNVVNGVISGSIKGLITVGVDPIYSLPNNKEFAEGYKKLEMTLAFAMKQDETASLAKMVAATPHYLESWGDAQIKKGTYSLAQPTIRPLFNTRQFQDSIITVDRQFKKILRLYKGELDYFHIGGWFLEPSTSRWFYCQ